MQPSFWLERWSQDQIGFHNEAVHADLVGQSDWLLDGGPHRVLVPLCGKTRDVHHIARQGHAVAGVELSEKAVRAMHTEQDIPFTERALPPYTVLDSGTAHLLAGDAFDLSADHLAATLGGAPTRVWDRAALVALLPDQRAAYVALVRSLLAPGARVLLNVLCYDASVMDGPPWSVDPDTVAALWAGADVQRVDRTDLAAAEPQWKERGHQHFYRDLYRITLPD